MKSRQSQTGSAHAVIIIVLVIAVLGLLGFVFYQNFIVKKDSVATTPTTTESKTTESTTNDAYAGWKTYENKDLGVSVRYPSDWTLNTEKAAGDTSTVGSLYSGTTKPQTADITIMSEPKSGPTGASRPAAVMALTGNAAEYGSMKYEETINSVKVTEYDMFAQTPYFAAVFPVGDNYLVLDFNTTKTKADLTPTLTKILGSVKAL